MNDLTNALEKLRKGAAESRAYLFTPAEARALVAEFQRMRRRQDLSQRGMGAAVGLVAAEVERRP